MPTEFHLNFTENRARADSLWLAEAVQAQTAEIFTDKLIFMC